MTRRLLAFCLILLCFIITKHFFFNKPNSTQPLSLELSNAMQEALNNGVALFFYYKIHERTDHYSPTNDKKYEFQLNRHTLSDQYWVKTTHKNQSRMFHSINDATQFIVEQSIKIVTAESKTNTTYQLQLNINTYKLPSPLRIKAFISPDWKLKNDTVLWSLNQ